MRDQRVELHRSEEIPAPADEVWALLTDWAGMMRWSLSAKRGGALGTLARCELIGEADKVPRTRRMIVSSGAAVEEQLFYQNDETKRIYYRKTDTFGTRGYIASSYVDELDDRRSRLHIQSAGSTPRRKQRSRQRATTRFTGVYSMASRPTSRQ